MSSSSTLYMVATSPCFDTDIYSMVNSFKKRIDQIIKAHMPWYHSDYVGTLHFKPEIHKGKIRITMKLIVPEARLPEDGYLERSNIRRAIRLCWLRLTKCKGELSLKPNIFFLLEDL